MPFSGSKLRSLLRFFYLRYRESFLQRDCLPFSLKEIRNRTRFTPKGVIHVGAHSGDEVSTYRALALKSIHLFEPQIDIFTKLQDRFINDHSIKCYQYALGSKIGKLPLYSEEADSPNKSASASLLKPKQHLHDYPHVKFNLASPSFVEVKTLDSFRISDADLLVIDTQGYEHSVLQGSVRTLASINWIICEYWSNEAYEDVCKIDDIFTFLMAHGFIPILQSYDRTFGDLLFCRPEYIL